MGWTPPQTTPQAARAEAAPAAASPMALEHPVSAVSAQAQEHPVSAASAQAPERLLSEARLVPAPALSGSAAPSDSTPAAVAATPPPAAATTPHPAPSAVPPPAPRSPGSQALVPSVASCRSVCVESAPAMVCHLQPLHHSETVQTSAPVRAAERRQASERAPHAAYIPQEA
jgi:hypothetical protein